MYTVHCTLYIFNWRNLDHRSFGISFVGIKRKWVDVYSSISSQCQFSVTNKWNKYLMCSNQNCQKYVSLRSELSYFYTTIFGLLFIPVSCNCCEKKRREHSRKSKKHLWQPVCSTCAWKRYLMYILSTELSLPFP